MISNFYYIKKAQFLHFYYSSIFKPIMKLFYDTNAPLRSAQLRPGHLVDALLTSSVRHYACLHAFQWILLVRMAHVTAVARQTESWRA